MYVRLGLYSSIRTTDNFFGSNFDDFSLPLNLLLEVHESLCDPGHVQDPLPVILVVVDLGEDPPWVGVDGQGDGVGQVHVLEPVVVGLSEERKLGKR